MVNPFEILDFEGNPSIEPGSIQELGVFMRWAHTVARPFDDNFITALKGFTDYVLNCRTTPNSLQEGFDVITRIDLITRSLKEERDRVLQLH